MSRNCLVRAGGVGYTYDTDNTRIATTVRSLGEYEAFVKVDNGQAGK